MRRMGNLFHLVTDYDNLLGAWQEVRRGKRMHENVLALENRLPAVLTDLRSALIAGVYRPRPCRSFVIQDPKRRTIEAPHLLDRIVQHALVRVIQDLIEARLIRQTYACIRGRGTHAASRQVHRYLREVPDGYVLTMDVRKFFPSIHHDTLMSQLARIIKCRRTLALAALFVRDNGTDRGIPIGATTSQILANLALNPLDHAAKRDLGARRYVRYMDDSVVVEESKDRLRDIKEGMTDVIHSLGLQVNPKSGIRRIRDGLDFVGYRHFVDRHLIRKRSLYNIRRELSRRPTLPRVMAYLSHAKGTASLPAVLRLVRETAQAWAPNINEWAVNHGHA